jgi:hypothetical protein
MNDFIEKTFFPEMREGLCEIFGVNTIEEIYGQKKVKLPNDLQRTSLGEIMETEKDHRERDVWFRFQNGKIVTANKSIGTEINITTLTVHSREETIFESVQNTARVYFGKPMLVAFHTHPRLISSKVHEANASSLVLRHKTSGTEVELPVNKGLRLINALIEYPSDDDIDHLLRNSRFWRSMLVGGNWGYKFIVNPRLTMPYIDAPSGMKNFKKSMGEAYFQAALTMQKDAILGIQMLHENMLSELKSYCDTSGLLLFSNSNPQNDVLNRVI